MLRHINALSESSEKNQYTDVAYFATALKINAANLKFHWVITIGLRYGFIHAVCQPA